MAGVTLLNPADCGEDDCYPCEECEEAPGRSFCQFRSGIHGENLSTRPTVAVHIKLIGTQTPACGICEFEEDYTYACGTSVGDASYNCIFNVSFFGHDRRDVSFAISPTGSGFLVQIVESVSHRGIVVGRREYRYYYDYDDFHYMDCDDNPVIDAGGDVHFSLASTEVFETYHVELCWIEVDELTVTNN